MQPYLKERSLVIPLIIGIFFWALFDSFLLGASVFVITLLPAIVHVYIPSAREHTPDIWFKRKLYGWGWTPATWQGWVVTFFYILLVLIILRVMTNDFSTTSAFFSVFLPIVFFTIFFLYVAYKKGEHPRWQWEDHKKHK